MLRLRCSTCDCWLPVFQLSTLCPICYKIRTIVKAYSAEKILSKLEDEFLIVDDMPPLFKASERTLESIKEEREEDDKKHEDHLQTSVNEYENKEACIQQLKEKVKNLKKKN